MRGAAGHWTKSDRYKRDRNQRVILAAKDRPCADCGVRYPHFVMDFDHVRGVKVRDVAAWRDGKGLGTLLLEIAKCEVVCANCHRLRTFAA